MNTLSNKILSKLTGLSNFLKKRKQDGTYEQKDLLDEKLFFLFENSSNKNENKPKKKKAANTKKKVGTSSEHSKISSEASTQ